MTAINKITDAEIMERLLEKLRYSANAFSKELGYPSHSSIYHVKEGRNLISNDMRTRIIERFPEVNYDFLIKGEEPILNLGKFKQNQMNLLGLSENNVSFDSIPKLLNSINDNLLKLIKLIDKTDE